MFEQCGNDRKISQYDENMSAIDNELNKIIFNE